MCFVSRVLMVVTSLVKLEQPWTSSVVIASIHIVPKITVWF